jgi:hypothetical protein
MAGLSAHVDQSVVKFQAQLQEHGPQMVARSRTAYQILHAETSSKMDVSRLPESERKRIRSDYVAPVRVVSSEGATGDKLENVQRWQPVPPFVSGQGITIRNVASGPQLKQQAEQEATELARTLDQQ